MRRMLLAGLLATLPSVTHAHDGRIPPSMIFEHGQLRHVGDGRLSPGVPKTASLVLHSLPPASIIPAIRREPYFQRDQTLCLALAIYHEARDAIGDQPAVAHVIFNRMQQSGSSVCATIWADGGSQFQWVRHPDILPREAGAWQLVQASAVALINRPTADLTHGATLFYNADLCSPEWANSGHVTMKLRHTYIRAN